MKNTFFFSSVLCVIIGLLLGSLLPMPWDEEPAASAVSPNALMIQDTVPPTGASSSGGDSAPVPESLDAKDNFPLLNTACAVCRALKDQDYRYLSTFVHPERGVTFTPYSTVNFDTDRTMSAEEIADLTADTEVHTWGYLDGRSQLIELTNAEYFSQYVFHVDYTQAPEIGVGTVMTSGNALENVSEAYPGCRFVDFSYPLLKEDNLGMDWCSLKLVFEPGETCWQLVGIVHGQWTI